MKKLKVLFFLMLGITAQSCICINLNLQNKDFISLFKLTDTLYLHSNYADTLKIKDDMILKYLCPVRNECLKETINNRELIYIPISRIDKGNYWLISYDVTDGYENKVYIASFAEKENRIISTLLVRQHIGDYYTINSKINTKNNTIKIQYYIKDLEDESKKHIVEDIYNLDASFLLISTNPQEVPIFIETH